MMGGGVSEALPLKIVTPEKVAWEGNVDSVVVPAWEGSWGIFPGHAPLLAQLKPGALEIHFKEKTELFAVSGGFVKVLGGRVSVFAETAELPGEIDGERARQALEQAQRELRHSSGDALDAQALGAFERASVRLRVLGLSRRQRRFTSQEVPLP
jgi:F-type H+-transporting ATPase subunit epsilon